jgi:hypothetical protein
MYPLASPRLGFRTLNLAAPMALHGVPLVNVRAAWYVLYTGSNVTSQNLKRLYNLSFVSLMNTPEQILHDRVNLVRLVRRLDKSVNGFDWGCEKSTTLWLSAEGLLQVGPFFSSLIGHSMTGPLTGPPSSSN